jgi:hypothetical protein
LPGDKARQQLWIIGSAVMFAASLFGVVLLAAETYFATTWNRLMCSARRSHRPPLQAI